jgi:diguanylate cyclase
MDFRHSLDQSLEYSQQALAQMKLRGIAPHPNNFMVWYCHTSGEWPELSAALQILDDADHDFDEERNARVFKKFCAAPFEALPLHLIADRIESELTAVLGQLDQFGRDASAFGSMLENVSVEVVAAQRAKGIRQIVNRVVSEARAMALRSRKVEQSLSASLLETEKLKAELQGAKSEALTDPLTALGNRRMFECVLRDATVRATETGEPLSLLLVDIDRFKNFNDDFGHLVGDQVLKLFAVVLKENIKGQDTAARYGGEEFAVVLPNTANSHARKLADNIRRNIGDKKLVNRKTGMKLRQITVSIGVAQYRYDESTSQFLERADRGLHYAKRLGRNQVICHEDVEEFVENGI